MTKTKKATSGAAGARSARRNHALTADYSALVQRVTAAAEAGSIRQARVRAKLHDEVARCNRSGALTNDQAALLSAVITSFTRARSGPVKKKTHEFKGAASDAAGARSVQRGRALAARGWPGEPGFEPSPRVRTVGDLAKLWMSDPGPVMAEYARAFGLTWGERRALGEVVRKCDFVGGLDVDDQPESARRIASRDVEKRLSRG